MSLSECYNCKHADEYLAWWWYRICDPTCELELPMDIKDECECYEQIGRLSR